MEYIRASESSTKAGYKPYKWVSNLSTPPWQPLRKPLSQSRLALVASGGTYVSGQVAFNHKDDTSFRAIPTSVRTQDLRVTHFAYDQTDARADPNVVFPIDTLRGLVRERFIGELTEHAYSFMGGIYSARRVEQRTGSAHHREIAGGKADLALLVPV